LFNEGVIEVAAHVDDTITNLRRRYGASAVVMASSVPEKEKWPLRILPLDLALYGGLPKGTLSEFYGPPGSGKSTLSLIAISSIQQQGGATALIDYERSFDPKYAIRCGVNMNKLVYCTAETAEQALTMVLDLTNAGVELVVLDSVGALITRDVAEGDIGDSSNRLEDKILPEATSQIATVAGTFGSSVLFTNQLRNSRTMFGNPETAVGCEGIGYLHNLSTRMEVSKIQSIKVSDTTVGTNIKVKPTKTKFSPPFETAELSIYHCFDYQVFNHIESIVNSAISLEVISNANRSNYRLGQRFLGNNLSGVIQTVGNDADLIYTILNKIVSVSEKRLPRDYAEKVYRSFNLN
jgi:recombination protein RecA